MTDFFDYGLDQNLNKELADSSTGVVYDTIDSATNAGSVLSGGNITLKTLNIGGLVRQVAPSDDMQGAIDAISREGGGTVQLLAQTYSLKSVISIPSDVAIVGAGRDLTIIDCGGLNAGFLVESSSALTPKENIKIAELTVQNSAAPAGIRMGRVQFWSLVNVKTTLCSNAGIRIDEATDFLLLNCISSSNTTYGFMLTGGPGIQTQRFSLINCRATSNTLDGFNLNAQANKMFNGSLVSCYSDSNTVDGFDFNASDPSAFEMSVTSCMARSNGGIGFDVNDNCQRVRLVDCVADTNTGDGFEIDGAGTGLVNCVSGDGFDINDDATLIGNDSTQGTSSPLLQYQLTDTNQIQSYMNLHENMRTIRKTMIMQNNSGAGLRAGNVVIFDSVASGDNATTTATNGDTKVWGMADATIASTGWGRILVEGYTTLLYAANGTASLAVGDFLSTYSHAYYAKKAVSGEIAFAISLEAPTTGTAVIDAVLIKPRQI